MLLRDASHTRLSDVTDTICLLVRENMITALPAVGGYSMAWPHAHRLAVLSWMLTALAQEVSHSEDVAVGCGDDDTRSPGAGGG